MAGLSHWKFGRFELYRVNPPLVRMVAALPVMAAGYNEDWSGFHEGPGARPVFGMGEDFVAANGERSFFLFMIARWACIPFSWIGGIVCYLWARDLYGRPSGVLACLLWSFSPNILAHASLITADAHATALGLAACYTFWRWLKRPTWTQAALTGLVLGLAELAKTTLILFYPLWPLLWFVYRWGDRQTMAIRDWLREGGMLLVRMAIGVYVLNLGYGFEGTMKPFGEFQFVSELFVGEESDTTANRFAGTWLDHLPVPFPKNYLLGIDIQQRDFEHYGRPSYLRGVWQDHGWWYYYLYAVAIKVPLGTWLLGLLVIVLSVTGHLRGPPWRDEMVLLVPAVVIFTVVSSKTGFNEHMRYVLPCFPFVFVWLGKISRIYLTRDGEKEYSARRLVGARRWKDFYLAPMGREGGVLLIGWLVTSNLWIYPHSLSYFNEAIGGPLNGAEHLLGSNVDWGQDLRYLQRKSDCDYLFLAYYGSVCPADVGFAEALPWPGISTFHVTTFFTEGTGHSFECDKDNQDLFLISVNLLCGFPGIGRDGSGCKVVFGAYAMKHYWRILASLEPKNVTYTIKLFR